MARGGPATTFGFPPFTRAVKTLIIANVAVYLVMMLSRLTIPAAAEFAEFYLYLRPVAVVHGQLWQLITYAFLHDPHSVLHLLFNMLGLWMFGSQFEMDFGEAALLRILLLVLGVGRGAEHDCGGRAGTARLRARVVSRYFRIMAQCLAYRPPIGASGGIFGLLIAFGNPDTATVRFSSFRFPSRSRRATLWRSGCSSPL